MDAQFDAMKIAEVAGKAAIARNLGCHPIDWNPADQSKSRPSIRSSSPLLGIRQIPEKSLTRCSLDKSETSLTTEALD